ncbi:zonular occludens toxin domain-containing protein [Stenotrophomonas maltophilia]|uniref:zonular occludens toxin domain-containing protein n=1 Tax=Stenotrophomonas maltophilia TaxID=40324 RepID=UPI001ED9AB02|nr:zonular occludens toxin domain-containing protein [Stenotrophomonas maltophilia]
MHDDRFSCDGKVRCRCREDVPDEADLTCLSNCSPGSLETAKPALMMERLVAEAKAANRPIFAVGIDGLDPGLATVLDDARHWNDKDAEGDYIVPNGSLIFVDEAWKWFGHLHDATRQQTPRHVLELAEHRHRGLDFVWTTQQPNQLYPFVRGLIGAHSHVVRRFGTKMLDVYRWGELNEEIKSLAKRDMASAPRGCCLRMSSGSTSRLRCIRIKARIPLKVLALPADGPRWSWPRLLGVHVAAPFRCYGCGGHKGDAIGVSRCGPCARWYRVAQGRWPRWPTARRLCKGPSAAHQHHALDRAGIR